ncbi:MAG: hypothetical protein K0S46_2065 [Moraxellaceae bacterium]|jgi:hypothetical protein|nr:hypothetical protein [Moraxellaceae bacterium]
MARSSSLAPCFLTLVLAPVLGIAAPASTPATQACSGASGTAATVPASDIDYPAINRHLLTPEATQRLIGLQAEIRKLDLSRAPEATLVRHRLLLAQAQTQAKLGMSVAAMSSLKSLPVTSPQAPEALLMLAEMEVKNGRPKAAVRWLRQMAEVFPEEPLTIQALWRAAELNYPHSRQAIALWQQAARHADQALASAQSWHARSQQPDFLDRMNSDKLSPELWRLARAALTDPAFASADAMQTEARRQLQCLTVNQDAQLRRMEKNPRLLADLNETVETLTAQLQASRSDIAQREKAFLVTAQGLKDCEARHGNCDELKDQHAAQGRELTGWRNRVQGIERKLAFLRQEEENLRVSGPSGSAGTAVASQLTSRLSSTRTFMHELLQQSLADAVQDWESLSAEAHYKLAVAQEPRVHPGVVPQK